MGLAVRWLLLAPAAAAKLPRTGLETPFAQAGSPPLGCFCTVPGASGAAAGLSADDGGAVLLRSLIYTACRSCGAEVFPNGHGVTAPLCSGCSGGGLLREGPWGAGTGALAGAVTSEASQRGHLDTLRCTFAAVTPTGALPLTTCVLLPQALAQRSGVLVMLRGTALLTHSRLRLRACLLVARGSASTPLRSVTSGAASAPPRSQSRCSGASGREQPSVPCPDFQTLRHTSGSSFKCSNLKSSVPRMQPAL